MNTQHFSVQSNKWITSTWLDEWMGEVPGVTSTDSSNQQTVTPTQFTLTALVGIILFSSFFVFDSGRCTLSPAESAVFLDSSQTLPQSIDLRWCNLSLRTRKKPSSLFFFSRFHLYNREKKECETVEEIKFHTRKCSRKKIFTNSSTNVFVYVRFIYVSPQQEDTLHRGF